MCIESGVATILHLPAYACIEERCFRHGICKLGNGAEFQCLHMSTAKPSWMPLAPGIHISQVLPVGRVTHDILQDAKQLCHIQVVPVAQRRRHKGKDSVEKVVRVPD